MRTEVQIHTIGQRLDDTFCEERRAARPSRDRHSYTHVNFALAMRVDGSCVLQVYYGARAGRLCT
eukprot:scaffold2800_cov135-Isochrysis_galbana.AAC.9